MRNKNVAQLQVKLADGVERAEAAEATEFHLRAELADLQGEYAERTGEMMGYSSSAAVAQSRVKDLERELAHVRLEMTRFRGRAFAAGGQKVSGCDHTTACLIWGDDGQGGTPESYTQPLPCNCGALANWAAKKLAAATDYKADAEALRSLATWLTHRGKCRWVSDIITTDGGLKVQLKEVSIRSKIESSGIGATLAAAIMDAIGKELEGK